jgi:hypothetical protein
VYIHLSQQQQVDIRDRASKRDALLIEFLMQTGSTAQEASNLKAVDLSQDGVKIAERYLPLPTDLAAQLADYTGKPYVF